MTSLPTTDNTTTEPRLPRALTCSASASPSWPRGWRSAAQPAFRAKQLAGWIYTLAASPTSPRCATYPARSRTTRTRGEHRGPQVRAEVKAKDGRTRKLLLELADGRLIETVLMLYPASGESRARATVCVSTQAGCAYGCTFCATGQMGFDRHLTAGEIVAQVLYFARELRAQPLDRARWRDD